MAISRLFVTYIYGWVCVCVFACVRVCVLRTFARNFFNIDFFLKILPFKDDELVMSEM